MTRLRRDDAFAALLQDSYLRLVGRPLVDGGPKDAAFLWDELATPLLAHDTSDDPRLVYVNRAAQACFEYGDEIAGLASRLTVEDEGRSARQRLLDEVGRAGFVAGYAGVRIAKSGRRFRIEDATIWELVDTAGLRHGQAATFRVSDLTPPRSEPDDRSGERRIRGRRGCHQLQAGGNPRGSPRATRRMLHDPRLGSWSL